MFEIWKKPTSMLEVQGEYTGLIKIRTDFVTQLIKVWKNMNKMQNMIGKITIIYMSSFIQHLIDKGWDVNAVCTKKCWAEIDTIEDLNVAHSFWRSMS